MSEHTFQLTSEQRSLLEQNPQFHAVSFLDDGDLLICEDSGPIRADDPVSVLCLWAVWVLTQDGRVQGPATHYDHDHDWTNEGPYRERVELTPPTKPVPHVIIDIAQAVQYLLLKYRVQVTPRTVRNWMRDGKLAGGQLGEAERSPWYTTRDAIDVAARRDWFPAPLPDDVQAAIAAALDLEAAKLALDDADERVGRLIAKKEGRVYDDGSDVPDYVDDEDPRAPAEWAIIHASAPTDVDDEDDEAVLERDAWLTHLEDDPEDDDQEASDGLLADDP